MAKHISNMDDLEKALQPMLIKMVDELAERVYETLNYFLNEYYEVGLQIAIREQKTSCGQRSRLKRSHTKAV